MPPKTTSCNTESEKGNTTPESKKGSNMKKIVFLSIVAPVLPLVLIGFCLAFCYRGVQAGFSMSDDLWTFLLRWSE